jgi:glucose dehydrogenase
MGSTPRNAGVTDATLLAVAALLPREAGEHLVYCTPVSRVIALDARNGKRCAGFGNGGEVLTCRPSPCMRPFRSG